MNETLFRFSEPENAARQALEAKRSSTRRSKICESNFHFLLEMLGVAKKYLLCEKVVILDSTFFCVRTLRQVSPNSLGSEMKLTLSFFCRNDKLERSALAFLSCKYSGEANISNIRSSFKSDSGRRLAMLSAESQVGVTLGQWKNIGLVTEVFTSVRKLGS